MQETGRPNVDEIYLTALQLPRPRQVAYLNEVCEGDEKLRGRVERLLSAQSKVGSLLDSPAPELEATFLQPLTAKPGTMIGPYKLLQKIGEGGMGVVYMAEQEQPVRRKVALKIIKPGMDSAQVVARFEAERQALAMMDHHNIAKVFEAGTTEGGRPYFVMELVHGVPITDYCDSNQLTADQRLQLFISVCHAIHHAHQKGIIHRDIKPSNILVTMYDDKPMPKVIDFGVAKAVQQRLTERTLFTEYGAVMGTFEYMSPEQAEMNAFGVDTRSDVYSLGVLLYELLTGTTPLERKRIRGAAFGEIVRLIKEEDAPRPSVRLSTSGELAKVAAARKTEPTKLSSLVKGELDWIVMRCLEKDRSRRYDGASSLAKDVEHYLHGEAVEACPPTVGYQLRKFTRRHRSQVIVASVVCMSLFGGIAGTTFGLIRAEKRRMEAERARSMAQENEQAAVAASQREFAQRERAEQAVERTFQVFDSMTSDDVSESLSSQPVISREQRKLYEIAAGYYRSLSQDQGGGEQSLARIADAATKLAEFEFQLGSADKAIESMLIALKPRTRLAEEFPDNPSYQFSLVLNYLELAKFYRERSEALLALKNIQTVQSLISDLIVRFPEDGEHLENWARIHHELGWELTVHQDFENAKEELCKGVNLYRKLFSLSPSPKNSKALMDAISHAGHLGPRSDGQFKVEYDGREENGGAFTEAELIARKLRKAEPTSARRRYDHAKALFQLGRSSGFNRQQQGLEHYFKAQAILEELVGEYPSNIEFQSRLARNHDRMTIRLLALQRFDEALSHADEALTIYGKLVVDYPTIRGFVSELGRAHNSKGNILVAQGRISDGIESFDKAIDILRKHPNLDESYAIESYYIDRAIANDRLRRFEQALSDWDNVRETAEAPSYIFELGRLTTEIQLETLSIDDALAQTKTLEGDTSKFNYWEPLFLIRFYSIAATLSADRKDELAGKAIELLRDLPKNKSFRIITKMKSNDEFEILREYAAFRELLSERDEAALAA